MKRPINTLDHGWALVLAALITALGAIVIVVLEDSGDADGTALRSADSSTLRDLVGRWENRAGSPATVVQFSLEGNNRIRILPVSGNPGITGFVDLTQITGHRFSGQMTLKPSGNADFYYATEIELSSAKDVITMNDRSLVNGGRSITTIWFRLPQ